MKHVKLESLQTDDSFLDATNEFLAVCNEVVKVGNDFAVGSFVRSMLGTTAILTSPILVVNAQDDLLEAWKRISEIILGYCSDPFGVARRAAEAQQGKAFEEMLGAFSHKQKNKDTTKPVSVRLLRQQLVEVMNGLTKHLENSFNIHTQNTNFDTNLKDMLLLAKKLTLCAKQHTSNIHVEKIANGIKIFKDAIEGLSGHINEVMDQADSTEEAILHKISLNCVSPVRNYITIAAHIIGQVSH